MNFRKTFFLYFYVKFIEELNVFSERPKIMIWKRNNAIYYSLLTAYCLLNACATNKNVQTTSYYKNNYETGGSERHSGLGFQIPDKFPIEILEGEAKPQTACEEIQKLSLSDESPIEPDQLYKGKMLKRGNNQQEKKAMLDRLVAQAQDLGASGLMNVNYKVFSTQKTTGYILSGTAFRYVMKR